MKENPFFYFTNSFNILTKKKLLVHSGLMLKWFFNPFKWNWNQTVKINLTAHGSVFIYALNWFGFSCVHSIFLLFISYSAQVTQFNLQFKNFDLQFVFNSSRNFPFLMPDAFFNFNSFWLSFQKVNYYLGFYFFYRKNALFPILSKVFFL